MSGDKPDRVGQKIIKLARDFKPDVILSVTGLLHPLVLEELGRLARGRRVLWWGDPPANSQKWGILDPAGIGSMSRIVRPKQNYDW